MNSVHLKYNDDIICFLALKWRNTWNLSVLAFLSKKTVAKNAVLGSPWAHFMHTRIKIKYIALVYLNFNFCCTNITNLKAFEGHIIIIRLNKKRFSLLSLLTKCVEFYFLGLNIVLSFFQLFLFFE